MDGESQAAQDDGQQENEQDERHEIDPSGTGCVGLVGRVPRADYPALAVPFRLAALRLFDSGPARGLRFLG